MESMCLVQYGVMPILKVWLLGPYMSMQRCPSTQSTTFSKNSCSLQPIGHSG